MIGQFRYRVFAPALSVAVDMFLSGGRAYGKVRMPAKVQLELLASWGQYADEPLMLAVALGFAVIIAAETGLDLFMEGDSELWDPQWGELVDAGTAPLVGLGLSLN